VNLGGKEWKSAAPFVVKEASTILTPLHLLSSGQVALGLGEEKGATLPIATNRSTAEASGGEHLSGSEVSSLPLNARDFSKLLLLAAGTMTDTNGAANFTQQFATNGQRGTASVFHIDGGDTSDPELGDVPHIRTPVKIDDAVRVRTVAPKLGQHNAEIFGRLGLTEAEIKRLRAEGVV